MESIRVYIPEYDLFENISVFHDQDNSETIPKQSEEPSAETILQQLENQRRKAIGYFDEIVPVYIVLRSEQTTKGKLTFEIKYKDEKSHMHEPSKSHGVNDLVEILDTPYLKEENIIIWKHSFRVVPSRNFSTIVVGANYKFENTVKINNNLKPFEEVNLIQLDGIELVSNSCLSETQLNNDDNDNENSLIAYTHSTELHISSLFKMSLKSYKSEKILAWLDLGASKVAIDSKSSIEITKMNITSVNCDITPCNNIDFPVVLNGNSHLTIVYYILFADGSLTKPLQVEIESIVDNHTKVKTTWSSNLDLFNKGSLVSNNNSSSLSLKKNGLLPAAKLSKLRTYSNLIHSKNTPKLPPPSRSSSTASVTANTKIPGNSVLGGKRYTSVKLKSGSNISLSQLWSETTSQTFQRGLVVTVTGPTRVKLGETFKWKIQLLNKSSNKMDLILYVQSSIKKEYEKTIPPIPIQSGNKLDAVPLFANNHLIRSFYYKFNRAGLVSLTNNLRVSLEYGNLYECELELLSIERGVFNIYDFKLLDVSSGDIFECNRLLDVMVT